MQPSLSLLQKQSLGLSPQLIQSIRLLQMNIPELNQFVAQELERNPLLEYAKMSRDLPRQGKSSTAPGDHRAFEEFVALPETLHDHVASQISFTAFTPHERLIANVLAGHLDDTGLLGASASELAGKLNIPLADVERVLGILQHLDPPGIFARSLGECLEIQLRQRDRFDPAMAALIANLDVLARCDYRTLKVRCGVDDEDLFDMLQEIRALDPKPGNAFHSGAPECIVPDVWATPSPGGGWQIEPDPNTQPKLMIKHTYLKEVSRRVAKKSKEMTFLNECLQNALWLISSLDQRVKTIVKVSNEIVRQQHAFLDYGVAHLRPLNLKAVADVINMHESTVSRVTSNKYMHTPRGVFELKYFFTVAIASCEGGDAHSAEAVRHRIKAMVAEESFENVLSDDEIADRLKEDGIDLARRTVAKYREAMNVPSSVQRRREKRLWHNGNQGLRAS
ncbi:MULTISPECIES: RNA polymerase factor sigma-54 [Mesorhizobium]|uniref:RNA polymerase factor sigma-54 n=1 Tax=Mesorhizobium TaxID=68287 RepID=UPI000A041997|nr:MULTISPECIES: RNA polymerase factor sigma-54 [Mesorhizobium]TPJ43699.1 RNA polymerase factor sigma-54 [Mesorhizobium sp. B2-6-6]ARP67324.1 RNA polymerase sigma-54 factor [Mesorhizobium sp. WSM1497]MCA0002948.1 RNA polymerase factor sigma-54 [Mesorhizobium sp. B264B2A]MCA0009234.1 RNA polymerase factor sigma-54 [Mesorhizobium sp. B264B1B]MCA0013965.1 RNA polymerase factor sigma-54 [Mesorhizobium sp. B294B1A1]